MLRKSVQWYRAMWAYLYGYHGPPRLSTEVYSSVKEIHEAINGC